MSPAEVLETARNAGISVSLTPVGTLKLTGATATITRLAPDFRTHKAGILKLLAQAEIKPIDLPTDGKTARGPEASDCGSRDGSAPEPYRQEWERLQARPPKWASSEEWRQAVHDAAAIFATWGELAVEFQWPPESIVGKAGLAWFTAGERVRSFGPEHAVTISGRVFDRRPRQPQGALHHD